MSDTEEEDVVEEAEMSLEELLAKVGLQDKADLLHQEQIDVESLVGSQCHYNFII